MKMKAMQCFRRVLDAAMTVASVLLMGGVFLFPSGVVHEVLGAVLLVLWIVHNVLNRGYYTSLLRGRYSAVRVVMLVVNCGTLVCAGLLAVSGIMLSNYVFVFLGISGGMGFARAAHLAASHWYFVFVALHFALHVGVMFRSVPPVKKDGRWSAAGVAFRLVPVAVSFYGLYAFFLRGLWKYFFLTQPFFFFDMERGFLLFLTDYGAIFVLFATAFHWIMRLTVRR